MTNLFIGFLFFLVFYSAVEWNKQRKEILQIRRILEKLADIDEVQGKIENKQREAIYTIGLGLDLLLEKLGYKVEIVDEQIRVEIDNTLPKKYKLTKIK